MKERLQKVLAHAGIASRRKSEAMIAAGRVTVNGNVITELGVRVDPDLDTVTVDGRPVGKPEGHVYVALNKPEGYLTTAKDDRGRRTVLDLLRKLHVRVYPVGRLDYDSEGLVFLTNDGQLAHRVMHPRHQIRKDYLVEVKGAIGREAVDSLRVGVELEDGITGRAFVEILSQDNVSSLLKVGIYEGRNRQIRRMFQAVGFRVVRLRRVRIGPLKLGSLGVGRYRMLSPKEVAALRQAVTRGS